MDSIHTVCQLASNQWFGVLTDIDDTLTRHGVIEQMAIQAIVDLRRAGIPVIAVTGRPVGWCEALLPQLPVDGIVAENGGVCLAVTNGKPSKRYRTGADERAAQYAKLQDVLVRIEQTVEGARRASDSSGRETDIAVDHSEHQHLCSRRVNEVVQLMRSHGLTATISSIHINGWIGNHNKWTGAQWGVQEILRRELDTELSHWVYVGDSANDEVMFQHMHHSVGVANIEPYLSALRYRPKYISSQERGAGFAEVARQVLIHCGATAQSDIRQ